MKSAVAQARRAILAHIAINPALLTVFRYPVEINFGDEHPNYTATPTTHVVRARIAHEKKAVPDSVAGGAGESTNLSRFILVDHKSDIRKYDRFRYEGKGWEIGEVDPLSYGGERTGYQAPLDEAANVPYEEIP